MIKVFRLALFCEVWLYYIKKRICGPHWSITEYAFKTDITLEIEDQSEVEDPFSEHRKVIFELRTVFFPF